MGKLLRSRGLFGFSVLMMPLLLALAAPSAQGQLGLLPAGGRSRIVGSVVLDGEEQPASRIRVEVKAVSGGDVATTFTDAGGRFEAPAGTAGSYVITVQEQGYEPVQQRVEPGFAQGLVITLRKIRRLPVERAYKVSVRDLRVPGKARRAFEKGLERLQKRDAAGSLTAFKEATNAYPDYYEAYYQIGLANLELRRGPDAEQALQRSIDLSGGGYAEPQFALGALLCDQQAYPQAERVLRRGIETNASDWKGHLFLGQALLGQNRLAEAEKSAQEVLLRNPGVPSVYILLANIHIRRQEYLLGIKELETYLTFKPEGPTSDQARAVRAAAQRIVSRLTGAVATPRFLY